MDPVIYFHIDELSRDAVVAANFQRVMRSRGVRVVFGNRLLSSYISKFRWFRKFDLYVFPGLAHFKTFVPDLTGFESKVVLLPTEGIGGRDLNAKQMASRHLGDIPSENLPWRAKVAAFCSWGPGLLDMFKSEAPEMLERFHVVGHPRYDYRCMLNRCKSHRDPDKIHIGLISRFSKFNVFDRRGMVEQVYESRERIYQDLYLSPGKEIEDQLYTETIDLRIFLDLILGINPEMQDISVRVHPREDRMAWYRLAEQHNLPIEIASWDQPFMHWIANLDYVVGPPSTSFYDCFVAGKNPISTQDISRDRVDHSIRGSDDDNYLMKHVVKPTSMVELFELISAKSMSKEVTLSEEVLELLKELTNYPDAFNSIDTFSDICYKCLNTSKSNMAMVDRITFGILSQSINVSRFLLRKFVARPEQSSTFTLTPMRKSFIRNLAPTDYT